MCNKQGEGEKGGGGKREDEKKLPPPRFPQKIAPRDLSFPQLTLVCVHTRGAEVGVRAERDFYLRRRRRRRTSRATKQKVAFREDGVCLIQFPVRDRERNISQVAFGAGGKKKKAATRAGRRGGKEEESIQRRIILLQSSYRTSYYVFRSLEVQ